MSETCLAHHDWFTAALTTGLCFGLICSYGPQHYRIIHKKSSEGFSPWFLLLGSTSSAAGMLNMIALQWGIIKCCRVLSLGNCIESVGGVFQVTLQWFLFTVILVLYLSYYPPHLKYVAISPSKYGHSSEWRLSIILAWAVLVHFILMAIPTLYLVTSMTHPIEVWAGFLGLSSALLAAIQYAPQLVHTYRTKLVGALSIPMMVIQSPGAAVMVLSIALRPGTNWTSWIMFAVSGIMQGTLLIMCIFWKIRQSRLGIDDFGHPLELAVGPNELLHDPDEESYIPGLVVAEEEDPGAVRDALAAALESAADEDVREVHVGEATPLLGSKQNVEGSGSSWFGWLKSKGKDT